MSQLHTLPHIASLQPYQPGMSAVKLAKDYKIDLDHVIKLASNENPYGMSPRITRDSHALFDCASRYPNSQPLLQALAKRYSLTEDNIILGNGSNDVLDLIARTFLGPNSEAVSSEYAFSIYRLLTQITGAKNIITTAQAYGHNLTAMASAINPRTRVIWIANPNNPTGTFISTSDVENFLHTIPNDIIVVLDEAYYEYLTLSNQTDTAAWIVKFPNLIITRTFSKAYGLAGLRVGYGIASKEVIALLNRVRQPFNVSSPAIHAALIALEDVQFVTESYRRNQAGLKQLIAGLERLHLAHLPTFGNFITVHFPDSTAAHQFLLKRGIIVRPLLEYKLPHHLRISVGRPEENDQLIAILTTLLDRN
jgi:histidinol-phosphate aminotransferase